MQVTEKIEAQLKDRLPEVSGAACLTISALTGQGLEGILPTALQSYAIWNQRVTTGKLNSLLEQVRHLLTALAAQKTSEMIEDKILKGHRLFWHQQA